MRGILTRMATFFVALLISFFLPEEFFLLSWEKIIRFCIIVNIIIMATGWEFPSILINYLPSLFDLVFQLILARKERLGILGIGIIGNQAMSYGFNWILYPAVIWKIGLLWGFVIMAILSFFLCYGLILFYDWSKKDWLGIETLKGLKKYDGNSKIGRVVSWIMRQSELVILIFLSVKYDPFIATVYMRKGSFNGMTLRDWKIFIISLIIGDIYWATTVFAGVSLVEKLLNIFIE